MNDIIQITNLNKIQAQQTEYGNTLLCSIENVKNIFKGFFTSTSFIPV